MKTCLLISVLVSFSLSQLAVADKIYSWVDDKGITHYGENPPKDVPAKQINARTGHSDPVNYETDKKPDAPKATAATGPEPSAERCELARKNLQLLTTNPRVKTTDKNGESRFMTPEEMQTQVENMEKIIADECAT